MTSTAVVNMEEPALRASRSIRRKKSLPNIFIMAREKSLRRKSKSPLARATSFETPVPNPISPQRTPTHERNPHSQPNLLQKKPSAVQLRIADAKRRRDEQIVGQTVEAGRPMTARQISSDSAQSSKNVSRRSSAQRSIRKQASYEGQPSHEMHINPLSQNPARAQYATFPHRETCAPAPATANFLSKSQRFFRPSQGEMDNFDFKLPQRPRTATIMHSPVTDVSSPFESPSARTRPRQVSDAETSYQRSPRTGTGEENWTPPWTGIYFREGPRESHASGNSTGSSTVESSSTQRSSVFTKMSSQSDASLDIDESEDYKDDIIEMYCGETDDSLQVIQESSDNDEEFANAATKRRSMAIAEAMQDTMGNEPASIPRSSTIEKQPPSPTGSLSRSEFIPVHQAPPLQTPTSTHDQYGFRKSSRDITLPVYESWHAEYAKVQSRRASKWTSYLKDNKLSTNDPKVFPEPSTKTRRFVQKGIPPAWRGNAWFFYAGGHEYLDRHPGRYQELLRQVPSKLGQQESDGIEKDLHRTFPDNLHFKPDTPLTNDNSAPNLAAPTHPSTSKLTGSHDPAEPPIFTALRRILSAFALDHPRIGYCQSLNFLAGMLLLFLPEERAFWLLHIITTDILPGTHEISLEGANVDLWVLMVLLKEGLPAPSWNKLGGGVGEGKELRVDSVRLPPISLCTTSWFMSLFIGTLPTESVLRVWDCLFYEGSRVLFRVALAVFKLGEEEIRRISDPMEVFQVVQTLPRHMIAVGVLMGKACARGGVSQSWVERRRAERRGFFERQRVLERARKEGAGAGGEGAERKRDVSRKNTVKKGSGDGEAVDVVGVSAGAGGLLSRKSTTRRDGTLSRKQSRKNVLKREDSGLGGAGTGTGKLKREDTGLSSREVSTRASLEKTPTRESPMGAELAAAAEIGQGVPRLERAPTRKSSNWFLRRKETARKV